jgi:hypothetical protein
MSTVTFDTFKFVKDLEDSGIPRSQAEAFVKAQREILSETMNTTIATHADIERIERKQIEHDGEFRLIRWMLGILIGGVVFILLHTYFPK